MTLLRPIIQPTSTEALQLDVGQVLLEIQGLQGQILAEIFGDSVVKLSPSHLKKYALLVVPNWRSWNSKDQGKNEKNIWVVSPSRYGFRRSGRNSRLQFCNKFPGVLARNKMYVILVLTGILGGFFRYLKIADIYTPQTFTWNLQMHTNAPLEKETHLQIPPIFWVPCSFSQAYSKWFGMKQRKYWFSHAQDFNPSM